MNKLGIFMNFWEKNWDADHSRYIRKAAELGYDILEFQAQPLLDMSDSHILSLRKLADEQGITLSYSLGLDPRYDISSSDEAVRRSGIQYITAILEKIHLAGGTHIGGITYAGWGAPTTILDDKCAQLDASIRSVRELAGIANQLGITYCVEVVNRFEGALLNTAQEALEYVRAVDAKNVGVLLDTYHMNIEEPSIGDAIRLVGDKLYAFHTGENNRTPPGMGYGHLDWDEIFSALSAIGYTGPIVSEPFVMMGGEVGRDIHTYRTLLPSVADEDLDKAAKSLLSFTKEMLDKYAG